jgi:hypothetical protein
MSHLVLALLALVQRVPLDVGDRVPDLSARDVTGQPEGLRSLFRGERTLVVVLTDRKKPERMRAWFDQAGARAPASVARVSIVSVGVPGIVPDSVARERARRQVPQKYWHATLLDTDHGMARRMGLAIDDMPYAMAVDREGRVLAWAHGTADSPQAAAIWRALGSPAR